MKIEMVKEFSKSSLDLAINNLKTGYGNIPCEAKQAPSNSTFNVRNMVGTVSRINSSDMSISMSTNRRFNLIFRHSPVKAIPVFTSTQEGVRLEKFDIVSYDVKEDAK